MIHDMNEPTTIVKIKVQSYAYYNTTISDLTNFLFNSRPNVDGNLDSRSKVKFFGFVFYVFV